MRRDPSTVVTAILDAARDCYLELGIEGAGMGEVAARAGIARSSLYRYFPSRDDLLVAVIERDMQALGTGLRRRLAKFPEPADHIVEGLLMALKEIPRQPLLHDVFAGDLTSRARRAVWNSPRIVALGNDFMQDVIAPALEAGALNDAVAPELLVEWVYRALLSLLTLPSNNAGSDAQLRAMLRALLIPVVLRPATRH